MDQNPLKICLGGCLGNLLWPLGKILSLLGGSWGYLGPKTAYLSKKPSKNTACGTPQGPESWTPNPTLSKMRYFFGRLFSSICCQLGCNLEAKALPKIDPSWFKNSKKMHQDSDQFLISFLIGLGKLFDQFCLDVGRPRDPKTIKNLRRFFWIVAILANLLTRGHMIDFLVNLALNMRPQNPPKFEPRGFQNQ